MNNNTRVILITIQRRLPFNLESGHLPVFQPHLSTSMPQPSVRRFTNVRATGMGVLMSNGRLLPESFPDVLESSKWKLEWRRHSDLLSRVKDLLKCYFLNRARQIQGAALWFTDTWALSYFFWLTEVIPRLCYARHALGAEIPIFLPAFMMQAEFVRSSLQLLGEPDVRTIEPGNVVCFAELMVPSRLAGIHHFNPHWVAEAGNRLRDAVLGCEPRDGLKAPRLLHISRRKSAKRRFVNQNEVDAVFDHFGFETVCMEDYPFAEQVYILSGARVLAGIHGAGLANMILMKPGGVVLELARGAGDFNSSYFNLASACGHSYAYQFCDLLDYAGSPNHGELFADVSLLSRNLELILSRL